MFIFQTSIALIIRF